jgi:hypothetical protein
MSAAYPIANDPFQRSTSIKIEERGTIIPSFYVRHENDGAGLVVTKNGQPLLPRFTVFEIPPERRWAILPSGELMDQRDFEEKLSQVYVEGSKAYSHDGNTTNRGNVKNEYYPRVEKYVSVKIDPSNPTRFVHIHYHPDATRGKKPDVLYTSEGEPAGDRLELLRGAAASDRLRGRLHGDELLEVERAERAAQRPIKQREPRAPRRIDPSLVAKCGKANFSQPHHVSAHERFCKACKGE